VTSGLAKALQLIAPPFPMKKVLLCLFSAVSLGFAQDAPEVDVWSYTGRDLFTSMIIAMATMDWNGDEQLAEEKRHRKIPSSKKTKSPSMAMKMVSSLRSSRTCRKGRRSLSR